MEGKSARVFCRVKREIVTNNTEAFFNEAASNSMLQQRINAKIAFITGEKWKKKEKETSYTHNDSIRLPILLSIAFDDLHIYSISPLFVGIHSIKRQGTIDRRKKRTKRIKTISICLCFYAFRVTSSSVFLYETFSFYIAFTLFFCSCELHNAIKWKRVFVLYWVFRFFPPHYFHFAFNFYH